MNFWDMLTLLIIIAAFGCLATIQLRNLCIWGLDIKKLLTREDNQIDKKLFLWFVILFVAGLTMAFILKYTKG
ncbi:hypothetical protein EPN96_12105 [bacterium]|nr:MAG: hypothetical protein EPN96_12105 [bacterium]